MEITQEQKPEDNVQAKPSTEDVELNEEQLEVVAGGTGEDMPLPDVLKLIGSIGTIRFHV
ncbi:hypothetical protein GCM10027423_60960 [Spirosoma arcticum]